MALSQYYNAPTGRELCLGFGDPAASRRIMVIPPLFDEMNRMRRILVSAMRYLDSDSIASFIPDLPGCNESLADLAQQSLPGWRDVLTCAAQAFAATHIVSVRGGALIDDGTPELPRWRLAPVKGESLLKAMLRTRIAGDKEAGLTTSIADLLQQARQHPIELAGNWLGPDMVAELERAEPSTFGLIRTVSLGEGPDAIPGSAYWLRAEPHYDADFAQAIAADIGQWSATCAG